MTREEALRRVLEDEHFKAFVAEFEQSAIRRVMSRTATEDGRAKALADYHGLQAFMAQLGAATKKGQ